MAGKIKGIYKSFKSISQIFVVKEREMEIGQPTDVVHVSHIGGDHPSTISPRWMEESKTGPNRTTKSTGSTRGSHPTVPSTLSSKGTDQSIRSEPRIKKLRNRSCTDLTNTTEKRKRRRNNTFTSGSSSIKSQRLSKIKKTSTQLGSCSDNEI